MTTRFVWESLIRLSLAIIQLRVQTDPIQRTLLAKCRIVWLKMISEREHCTRAAIAEHVLNSLKTRDMCHNSHHNYDNSDVFSVDRFEVHGTRSVAIIPRVEIYCARRDQHESKWSVTKHIPQRWTFLKRWKQNPMLPTCCSKNEKTPMHSLICTYLACHAAWHQSMWFVGPTASFVFLPAMHRTHHTRITHTHAMLCPLLQLFH